MGFGRFEAELKHIYHFSLVISQYLFLVHICFNSGNCLDNYCYDSQGVCRRDGGHRHLRRVLHERRMSENSPNFSFNMSYIYWSHGPADTAT